MKAPTRPVMRYHGGKWLLAPWIISHFPPHKLYVEAFAGAASVLIRKPRSKVEIMNDLDGEVVNIFRMLRDRDTAAQLENRLRLTPFSRAEFNLSYEPTDDPVEKAARTLVRQMMGFGTSGLVRTRTGFRASTHRNRTQDYSWDWARYPDYVRGFYERLIGVVVEQEPALKLLDRHDQPDALWYLDPPYVHSTRGIVRPTDELGARHNGYRHEMTDDDHRALAERLHRAKASVVISGYPSDLYDRELFADWRRMHLSRVRAQGQRGMIGRTEVLWLNPRAAAALNPTLFECVEEIEPTQTTAAGAAD